MIAYAASALELSSDDASAIHTNVYTGLREHVDEERYVELIDPDYHYRHGIATDADLFMQQLPFYKPRLIFNGAVFLLSKAGLNIFFATHLISAFFAAAAVVMLFLIVRQCLPPGLAMLVPFFAVIYELQELATLSTPDTLALFIVCATVLSVLRENNWVLLLLPVSVLVRTDLVIWSSLIILFLLWSRQLDKRYVLTSAALTLVTYVFINLWAGNYGWQTLFYFTFINKVADPATLVSPLTVQQYWWALSNGLRDALMDKGLLLFLAMIVLSFRVFRHLNLDSLVRSPDEQKRLFVIVLPLIYVLVHFVLYPVLWARFFSAFYLIAAIGFLWTFSAGERQLKSNKEPV